MRVEQPASAGPSISTRFLKGIFGSNAVLLALLVALAVAVVLPRFGALERFTQGEIVERLVEISLDELGRPSAKIKDWASWDDANAFMGGTEGSEADLAFKSANLLPDLLDFMDLDSIRYYRPDGSVRGGVDRENPPVTPAGADGKSSTPAWETTTLPLAAGLDEALTPARIKAFMDTHVKTKGADGYTPHIAILKSAKGPIVVSAQPVLPSSGEGEPTGMLVFAKRLTPRFATELSRLSKADVALLGIAGSEDRQGQETIAGAKGNAFEERLVENPSDGQLVSRSDVIVSANPTWTVSPASDEKTDTAGRLLLRDVDGDVVGTVFFPLSRGISHIGIQATLTLVAGVVGLLLLCALILRAALARAVVRPVTTLAAEVRDVRSEGGEESGGRTRVSTPPSRGEVTMLAVDINDLLVTIEERNKSLSDISKNVTVGVLITDARGVLLGGHTRFTGTLLLPSAPTMSLEGRLFTELLFPQTPREKENFDALYEQVFEDLVPEDITLSMLPERVLLHDRTLSLTGAGLRDSKGTLAGILWTVIDITARIEAERQNRLNSALLRIVRRVEPFRALVASTRDALGSGHALLTRDTKRPESQADSRRTLHTLKGNFGVYGLVDLAALVHEIEEKANLDGADFDTVRTTFETFVAETSRSLGIRLSADEGSSLQIGRKDIETLHAAAASWTTLEEARRAFSDFISENTGIRLAEHVEPIGDAAISLAARYGKKLAVRVEGQGIRVPRAVLTAVVDALTHATRNSAHHGIELPSERRAAGKTDTGNLVVAFQRVRKPGIPDVLRVCIEDDGRGFDLKTIRSKAAEKGLISQATAGSLDEAGTLELVFLDGLSTASTTNDVAGRGVGMAAIRTTAQALGGSASVSARSDGPGSLLVLEIPFNQATVPARSAA